MIIIMHIIFKQFALLFLIILISQITITIYLLYCRKILNYPILKIVSWITILKWKTKSSSILFINKYE